MKIRLTESQYDKLLKVVNSNKKLIITETQYKRLLLEFAGQFTTIEEGNGIKIISNGKEFTFKVFGELNGELLVRNLNDGRYKSQYFLFNKNGLKNKTLRAEKSGVIKADYNDITTLTSKEQNANWKQFIFQNVTSFQVFSDETFKLVIDPKIDTKTGKVLSNPEDKAPEEIKQIDFKDALVRGIESNHMYQLTFYDNSTVKFKVSEKEGSVITIEFETVSERSFIDSNTFDKNTEEYKKFEVLQSQLKNASTEEEKTEIEQEISILVKDREDYDKKDENKSELKTIKKTVYNGGVATKWVGGLEDSVEYKDAKELKIDLSKVVKHPNKIKVANKDQEAKINKLNQELAMASTDEEKKKIQDEIKDIDRELTLHFLNPDFDVYNKVSDGIDTFDLTLMLNYRPESVSKKTKNGMEWSQNYDSKMYSKNFPLYGLKNLTIIKDKVLPSLTDKREVNKGDKLDLSRKEMEFKKIKDYIYSSNASSELLRRPKGLMRLLNTDKGVIPLETLQAELGNNLKTKDKRDKFIAGNYVAFKADFESVSKVDDAAQLETFKRLITAYGNKFPKAVVKKYTVGDNHVSLIMKDEESGIMYSLFIQNADEDGEEKLAEDTYNIQLKFNNNSKQAKKSIAKFKIEVKDYHATKLS
jgi:hypothetical protein